MTIFYIDTTSNYLYTGLVKDSRLLIDRKLCLSHSLSSFAQDEIVKMFNEVNLIPQDIDKVIVVNGPGSFTGIRIGVTIAKVLAWSLKKEIITISSLEAMAEIASDKIIVPIIDARRGACYTSAYLNGEKILDEQYIQIDKLLSILNSYGKDYIFISNNVFKDIICEKYDPNILRIVSKYQDRESINPHFINPKYLKLTEAEENREKEVNHD